MAEPAAPARPSLVGRERELEILRGLLDRAWAEEAQTLVVSGDAGVGKTALVARACADRGPSAETVIGACLPLTSMSIPFLPFRSALRGFADAPGIRDVMTDRGEFVLRFDAWLDRRCATHPVVLVIDDVQWADRSTLDALMYVVAGPPSRRLAVVATVRSGEIAAGSPQQRWFADVRRMPRTTEMVVDPLDRAGTAAQVESLLGGPPHQSLVDDVHLHARGNPYFTRLMVAGLSAAARTAPSVVPPDLRSAVLRSWYGWSSPATRALASALAVGGRPAGADELAEVLGEEVRRVRARIRAATDSGALVALSDGTVWFQHPLNAEVLEAELNEEDRRKLHARFADSIERSELGSQAKGGPAVDAARTAVAVADHRAAAKQTAKAYEWSLVAADLVGGPDGWTEQLRLLRQAIRLRADLPDAEPSEVELLYRLRSVAAVAGAPTDELDAVESLLDRVDGDAQPLVAAELLVRRMHLRDLTGNGFIDVDEMRKAVRLAEADMSSPVYALTLAELAHAEVWTGHPDAPDHAAAAIAVARGADDGRALSHALAAGSMTAGLVNDAATAQSLAGEAVALARVAGDWWAYVHATMWEADSFRTWGSARYSDLMRERRQELVDRGGPRAYAAWMASVEAQNWLMIGDSRASDECLRVVLGSDPGPLGDAMGRLVAARGAALRGRQAEAESHLLRVEEIMADSSAYLGLELDAVRAEVRLGAQDPHGAFRAAMAGIRKSGAPPTRCQWLLPLAARALADRIVSAHDHGSADEEALRVLDDMVARFPTILRDIGPTSEVRSRLDAAFDVLYAAEQARARQDPGESAVWLNAVDAFATAGLPWEEAYSTWRAAEALLGRGRDRRKGVEMLRRGVGLVRRLSARPIEHELLDLARRAHVAMDEPERAASVVPATPHPLTGREREVLALIAVGRTYSEIARALMISEKTVSTHVSHLLAKTGSANRVELAGLVHRLDGRPPSAS